VTIPEQASAAAARFEVAVAVTPLEDAVDRRADGSPPGVSEATSWRRTGRTPGQGPVLLEKGDEIVRRTTEALAGQIGMTARQIAETIGRQEETAPAPGVIALDSVEVSFGVTLSAGVQALFTAQAESSVQVTITLSRHHDNAPGSS
jgi:hypothetical protein